jgi:phage baseplate assembly protein V
LNVQRQFTPINRRIRNLVSRSVVQLTDVSKLMQTLQLTVLKDEVLDGVEYFEPHGFTSRAKAGAEAVLLCPGGNRSSAIAIVVADRRYRLQTLQEGEVALYDDAGNIVHLKQDGTIAVTSPTSVDVTAPTVTMSGDLAVTGNITAANMTASAAVADANGNMQEMRDTYNAHNHPTAPTGPVSPPSAPMI